MSRRQEKLDENINAQNYKRKWAREEKIEEMKKSEMERIRLEKLHLKQQRDREILQQRLKERSQIEKDSMETLKLYLNYKDSVKDEYIQTVQKQRQDERSKLLSFDLERRNKVLQNRQTLNTQKELASKKELIEMEKKLMKSKELHDQKFQEKILLYKRLVFNTN